VFVRPVRLALPTVIDARSRRLIGWAIDNHTRAGLAQAARAMAITLRRNLPESIAFHSDRGTKYASGQTTVFAAKNGLTRSTGYRAFVGTALSRIDFRVF
jgi:transposase InsO family protein